MLEKLFRPAWQSASADKRRKAVIEMDAGDTGSKSILFELAKSDDDKTVRLTAIGRISDLSQLSELLQNSPEVELKAAIEQRLESLLSDETAIGHIDIASLLNRFVALRPFVAACATDPDARKAALQMLTQDQLLEVLGNTVFTDCRQLIAERLDDIENLEAARKVLRGKDKNAERIVKSRIDSYRENQRQQQRNRALVDKLLDEVEYLVAHDWLADFRARCAVHRQQWDSIDFEIDEGDKGRYEIARRKLDALLEQQQIVDDARLSQQQMVDTLQERMDKLLELELMPFMEAAQEIDRQLHQCRQDWDSRAKVAEPEAVILRQYQKLTGTMRSALDLVSQLKAINAIDEASETPDDKDMQRMDDLLNRPDWPADIDELRIVTGLKNQLQNWRDMKNAEAEAYRQKLDRVNRHINRIFHFSRSGNLPRARQMAQKAEKSLAELDPKAVASLQDKYDEAVKVLEDMGDWKNYATEPKYQSLCESMERLIDSSASVEKRYEEMQSLQKQWKALGHSDVSDQYWPRFKQAADSVYQPCAEYFQQRREQQKANLEERRQFVDQMRALLENTDWENKPDYRDIQAKFYKINSHFTRVKDVEHRPGQKQWREFSRLKEKIKTRLAVAYDENIEIKKRLVLQAGQLAEMPASLDNQEKLKSLQARWNAVGITRRKQDQKAWVEFKSHCDDVYNQLQSLRREVRKDNDQQLDGYRKIIRDIQKLAKQAESATDAERQFAELQAQYDRLPELPAQIPQKLADGIRRDYVKACELFEKRQHQMAGDRQARLMEAMREKARLCELLESQARSSSEAEVEQIMQQWQAIAVEDPELNKRIESRRQSAASELDRAEIAEQRRMLCLQLEIASDKESPVEDRELRMQYQLQRMNQSGLGHQANPDREWFRNIELDWLCLPGAEASVQAELNQRFRRALRKS